jgi:hypothetical protein
MRPLDFVGTCLYLALIKFMHVLIKFAQMRDVFVSDLVVTIKHSYDILGARMLWKPKEARILTNFIDQLV